MNTFLSKLFLNKVIVPLLFFTIIAIPFFYKLGNSPLRHYDESFYALKAFHWAEHGEYLKNYDPHTHLLSTKPYLFTWIQACSYQLFGYTNFALRFPVALFGLFTCCLCWFSLYRLNAILPAYFSATILAISFGFLDIHMSRTGDHDVPISFFLLLNLYFSYLIIEEDKHQPIYFISWALSLTAAILTKGIIGIVFMPGIFLYAFVNKKFKDILSSLQFYLAVVLVLLLVSGYYIHREIVNPGYIQTVFSYEIGRYFNHEHQINSEFSYFFKLLYKEQFFPWILFVPFGIAYIFTTNSSKKFVSIATLAGFVFLFIISFSKAKLKWYDAPIVPILSILSGCGIYWLYNQLPARRSIKFFSITLIILLFSYYYIETFKKAEERLVVFASEKFDPALYYLKEHFPNDKKISIVTSASFNPQTKYLMQLFNSKYSYSIQIKKSTSVFVPGEKVLICEPHTIRSFNKKVKSRLIFNPSEAEFREVEK